ncbi:MAG: hypothetical protein AAF570_24630, partial [Bacteroidota bacterium]
GKVVEETIWCPFHGFRFDVTGDCTHTSYGTPPSPKCEVFSYPIFESHGVIGVWFDSEDRPPRWEIPVVDMEGWTELGTHMWELDSHPQETTENSVDVGHLSVVHKYVHVDTLRPMTSEGAYLNARYTMSRKADFLFSSGKVVRSEFDVHAYGLGYSFVEVEIDEMKLETRQFVLPTPTDEGKMELRIAMCMKFKGGLKALHPALRFLPKGLATRIVLSKSTKAYAHDVYQDFDVWQNKVYVHPPALAKGDGPVIQYRKWAHQFYTEHEGEEKPRRRAKVVEAKG